MVAALLNTSFDVNVVNDVRIKYAYILGGKNKSVTVTSTCSMQLKHTPLLSACAAGQVDTALQLIKDDRVDLNWYNKVCI